jgi:hypothetical protein
MPSDVQFGTAPVTNKDLCQKDARFFLKDLLDALLIALCTKGMTWFGDATLLFQRLSEDIRVRTEFVVLESLRESFKWLASA